MEYRRLRQMCIRESDGPMPEKEELREEANRILVFLGRRVQSSLGKTRKIVMPSSDATRVNNVTNSELSGEGRETGQ